ncbi:MAG: hypothetical protein Q8K30_03155 [Candidatus Gracilibacteria bacterium]|nr:hypothetical protein [Candidatus Gracilibacteria bacterium]MDP2396439.1 hypothetical protein [bacterium]MDP3380265.1 hypothetical protein [bacterium]
MNIFNQKDFRNLLSENNIVVTEGIFVYKSGFIGTAYINKEALAPLGADIVNSCLCSMTQNALDKELNFKPDTKTVLIIGPAYGAISYPPIVAFYLRALYPSVKFVTSRTEVDSYGRHFIPEKLNQLYVMADEYIIVEDIVNEGTTIREVSALLPDVVNSVICLVDRGNNNSKDLGIEKFYPFLSVDMESFDPRVNPSLLNSGKKINTVLGKGKIWVEQFGQPPYGENVDFSKFSLFK